MTPSSRFLLAALGRSQWKPPRWLQPHRYSHIKWIFQMTHQSETLQREREFMVFQYIIYYFHNRSYRIINDKQYHFNLRKNFSWGLYKPWPYLASSLMIRRREKQCVKDNHYLCETGRCCQLRWGPRHSAKGPKGPKGHADMMGKDATFRPDKYKEALERGREEIIQNWLQCRNSCRIG